MQCTVTVVNLVHDTQTETDRPVCRVLPGCSWRETQDTSGHAPKRTVHVRIPPSTGYLPYAQWAKLPPAEKAAHWTLKRGGILVHNTPYARRQYYLHESGTDLHGDSRLRGSYWGQRAIDANRDELEKFAHNAAKEFLGGGK